MRASVSTDGGYQLPQSLHTKMRMLYKQGFALIPLGGGTDGKSPLVRFKGKRLPFQLVVDKMERVESTMYGILTRGITVVDCDTDNTETVEYAALHFGNTRYVVKSPRGRHFYFAGVANASPIRTSKVAIDIKSGPNQYVVGPESIRPDGGCYRETDRPLNSNSKLPQISRNCIGGIQSTPQQVPEGTRNRHLYEKAIEWVKWYDNLTDLYENLLKERDIRCEDPSTVSDSEVHKVAVWAWNCRLDNKIYQSRDPTVSLKRSELQRLEMDPNAVLLIMHLKFAHSAKPGKQFAICGRAMASHGLIANWSRSTYERARKVLVERGFLREVKKGIGKGNPNLYQLTSIVECDRNEVLEYLNDRG